MCKCCVYIIQVPFKYAFVDHTADQSHKVKRVKRSGERMPVVSKEDATLMSQEDLIHHLRCFLELFKVTTTVAFKWEGDSNKLDCVD
jgi:hypothetical protein